MSTHVDVKNCARCGGDHSLRFERLANAVDAFNYWSTCPVLGQPVLLAITPSPCRGRCADATATRDVHPGVMSKAEEIAFLEGLKPAGRHREGFAA